MIAIGNIVTALAVGLTEFDITDPPYLTVMGSTRLDIGTWKHMHMIQWQGARYEFINKFRRVLPAPEDGDPLQSLGGGGEDDLEDQEEFATRMKSCCKGRTNNSRAHPEMRERDLCDRKLRRHQTQFASATLKCASTKSTPEEAETS
ncbi:hypothetical protein JCGZ_25146 [Jatropha curcas]|uniref:Uncharacterized protein n=1 Tax=Jatropha curcas TaxID=180498 RepID=A0A067L5K6_JATCU|nr:hypothetical protein JCGZ_25146 [Jatropha curcas]